MRKLLNNPAFVTVLALVALGFVGWSVLSGTKPPVPVVPDEGIPVADTTVVETLAEAVPEPGEGPARLSVAEALKALVIPATLRDPFALPARPVQIRQDQSGGPVVEVVERLRLSAIWVQGPAVYLLLNGQICQPGEDVDRFTVETASVEGAWIRHAGDRSFLPVGQELVVRTSVPGPASPLSP
jgi:hypothetical protein